ncbi:MAG: hypothetical protein A2V86_14775 [Deltaproteobacteria bacterium RBG_16_49_23]|nr:MAG: hypothetical protein A2V86_14775 [Deltaproteobacteria bacterium RBG_16_49_23]
MGVVYAVPKFEQCLQLSKANLEKRSGLYTKGKSEGGFPGIEITVAPEIIILNGRGYLETIEFKCLPDTIDPRKWKEVKIMKKIVLFLIFIIMLTMVGCAELRNHTQVEQKYGPPAKKEEREGTIVYYYYFEGRRKRIPYERYKSTYEFTFDKDGNLIDKKRYFTQPTLEEVK